MRVERERQRAAEEANRRQAESERKLQEQSKVLSALAPVQKNLDALQTKVAQIEEGRKHEMGALGEQLKGLGEQQARLDRRVCWNMSISTPKLWSPTPMDIRNGRI